VDARARLEKIMAPASVACRLRGGCGSVLECDGPLPAVKERALWVDFEMLV
jgi:hypothetical protein